METEVMAKIKKKINIFLTEKAILEIVSELHKLKRGTIAFH